MKDRLNGGPSYRAQATTLCSPIPPQQRPRKSRVLSSPRRLALLGRGDFFTPSREPHALEVLDRRKRLPSAIELRSVLPVFDPFSAQQID